MQCDGAYLAWLLPGHTEQREGIVFHDLKAMRWCGYQDYVVDVCRQHADILILKQGIIDISVGLGPDTVFMDGDSGMGDFRYRKNSIDDGDFFNGSVLKEFTAHAGGMLSCFHSQCRLSAYHACLYQ